MRNRNRFQNLNHLKLCFIPVSPQAAYLHCLFCETPYANLFGQQEQQQ